MLLVARIADGILQRYRQVESAVFMPGEGEHV